MSDKKRSPLAEFIDSYRENPIATVVVLILLPVLFLLSMIRKLLILNMKLANYMFDRYDTGIKLIGVALLKMRKFDRKK
ncbi:hypothetical protein [Proteus terrae]|uniref:hypothetical protein n=1 Tax=Proteus terrae TaxID=1574161 RepID=UPI001F34BC9D|nr:hypothetical protein [Proteus terrae]